MMLKHQRVSWFQVKRSVGTGFSATIRVRTRGSARSHTKRGTSVTAQCDKQSIYKAWKIAHQALCHRASSMLKDSIQPSRTSDPIIPRNSELAVTCGY